MTPTHVDHMEHVETEYAHIMSVQLTMTALETEHVSTGSALIRVLVHVE